MISLNKSALTIVESWFIPLNIIMIICTILVIILATVFCLIIIFDKTCHTMPMILTINSCIAALIFGCSLLGLSMFTLKNDLKQIQYEDSLCIFRGYIILASAALLNYSNMLQAFYRYITVVYSTRLFWKSVKFQLFFICLTWIFSFAYPFVCVFTGEIIYNVDNQICQVPLKLSFYLLYIANSAYIIPISMIVFIYLKLVRYVKGMSKRVTPANILVRAKRELKMVQRIVILLTILIVVSFPLTLFIFMSFFNSAPKYHFRIIYMCINVSLLLGMIALFLFTDLLKTSLMNRIKRRSNIVVVKVT